MLKWGKDSESALEGAADFASDCTQIAQLRVKHASLSRIKITKRILWVGNLPRDAVSFWDPLRSFSCSFQPPHFFALAILCTLSPSSTLSSALGHHASPD
jgi:hypothetical protein